MIVMADMFVYFLLSLLLDGDGTYYGQSSGTHLIEGSDFTKRLLFLSWYIWYTVNIAVVLLVVYRKILKALKDRTKARNISR